MTEAQTILKMIEGVDPSDTAVMNEIDARFWCWWNGKIFAGADDLKWAKRLRVFVPETQEEDIIGWPYLEDYSPTKSRDFLKSIRPEGWWFSMDKTENEECVYRCGKINEDGSDIIKITCAQESGYLTEELAEFHVIIQATEWERRHD